MVTIKDVAKHAGVSVATVSRVINKKEPLTEKTIKKVNDAIEELGYYPNTYARTLVGRKDNSNWEIMLPFFNNPFHSELAQEIEFWAKENQFHILFTATGNSDEERFRALEYLLSRQVSGIIISTYINPETAMEMRRRCKVPILELLNHLWRNPAASCQMTAREGFWRPATCTAKNAERWYMWADVSRRTAMRTNVPLLLRRNVKSWEYPAKYIKTEGKLPICQPCAT